MLEVNSEPYDDNSTDSVVNFVVGKDELYSRFRRVVSRYHSVLHAAGRGLDSKNVFKEIFGQQRTTKSYSRRNWVWTFGHGGTLVHVLISVEGVSWEYSREKSSEHVVSILEQIVDIIDEVLK